MAISIQRLIDDNKCYVVVRELRWPVGVKCPNPVRHDSCLELARTALTRGAKR